MQYNAAGGRRLLSLLALTLVFVLTGCQNNGASTDEGVPYTVGEPLSDSTLALAIESEYGTDTLTAAAYEQQVQRSMQQFARMLQQASDEERAEHQERLRRQVLTGFITQHVANGEIEKRGFTPEIDTAQVIQSIDQRIQQAQSQSKERFDAMLSQRNLTLDQFRSMMVQQQLSQAVMREKQQMLIDEMTENVEEPTAMDVDTFRENNRKDEVRAEHILFKTQNMDKAQSDSVKQVASDVLAEIESGADFGEMVERYSEGPSRSKGGDLGWFAENRMVPPFSEAAFSMSDSGEVYKEPVKTRFGYHIIRLTGRRTAPAMDSSRAVQSLKQEKRRDAIEEGLDELRAKATIHVNDDVVDVDLTKPGDDS